MPMRGRLQRIAAWLALSGSCAGGLGCQSVLLPQAMFNASNRGEGRRVERYAASVETAPNRRTCLHGQTESAAGHFPDLSSGVAVSEVFRPATPVVPEAKSTVRHDEPPGATPGRLLPVAVAQAKPPERIVPPKVELMPGPDTLPAPRPTDVLPDDMLVGMTIPAAYPSQTGDFHPWAKYCDSHTCVRKCQRDVPVADAPKEGQMRLAPPYVIENPDILLVEAPRSLPDQPISGEHLVRMDGTVSLGLYGSVRVAGLTVDEAREVIERHLTQFLKEPKVNVDVYAYNSKFFYIIADGAGFGQQVVRLNYTGNDTVLSAISQISGLPSVASKKRLWIARPNPGDPQCGAILPINWTAITQCAQADTNYQLFPNDRIYIQSDRLLAFDGLIAKIVSPIERALGVSLLGAFTVSRYQNLGRFAGGGGGGGGGGF